MPSHVNPSTASQKGVSSEERQARIERVAELINKYRLTHRVIAERLGVKKRVIDSDAGIARKQGLIE